MSAAPAAVGSTTSAAMEATAAAAVEAFTTMEATAAMSESTTTGVTVAAARVPVAAPVVAAVVIATPTSVIAISTAAVVAVVPRAGADKDAADKVVRTVVAVRRTRIWVIAVVAVSANRSGSYISGTNSNANGDLSVGVTCRKHQNAE
jgi:hypothetical protein